MKKYLHCRRERQKGSKMQYILGANYWGRRWGTDMWLHYDGAEIREEMRTLAEYGVKCLRVFPNWRDFQPVEHAYAYKGTHGEYVNSRTGAPVYGDGVDPEMIDHFRDFCRAAEENGITLVVSIVTGWMSGRLFVPPVVSGRNLITDPEALMWMRRFIHRFVREFKNEPVIIMWGLGNECNCMAEITEPSQAYLWTTTVVDSIRSEDPTRLICSDMHSLTSNSSTQPYSGWLMEDQGELCDLLSTHPYPSPTVGGDTEPYNRLRVTMIPTAQSLYYSGVSKKPVYVQEQGTFLTTIGSRDMAAQFMRINVLSTLANGVNGYQWWCAWEQDHLDLPPYSWSMMERQLGLFDADIKPKPVALEMQKLSKLIDVFPDGMPKRVVDGICVLSRGSDHQNTAISSLIFGKQAGVELEVAFSDCGDIKESDLYFMPCITGWQVLYKKTWDVLCERVKNGATLCVSYNGGMLADFEAMVGATSSGVMADTSHYFMLDGEKVAYTGKEVLLNPTTAEVILENECGNPVMLKNKVGKGCVYFVNFAPERTTFATPNGFNINPYYKLYGIVAKDMINAHIVTTDESNAGITHNPISDSECYVTVLNYGDKDLAPNVQIKDGWQITETIYGNIDLLGACDGAIVKIEKK